MIDERPLAERIRPNRIGDIIGQNHLIGETGAFHHFVRTGNLPSIILWGPPGVGKTTLAQILATEVDRPFKKISAIDSGVKEVREAIKSAKNDGLFAGKRPILFIDEIHRFSKSQQDSLLEAVEKGIITLVGATTENPSFEVISALLSRCQVYTLKSLDEEGMDLLIKRAIETDPVLRVRSFRLESTQALKRISGGDGRKLLNALELVAQMSLEEEVVITDEWVEEIIKENMALYDKGGEQHYDIISAFIKSIRGSDVQASLYWLARMLVGGEDPKFIARRLIISASEDIGLANPNALLMANSCFDAVTKIGMPEARIILSQCTVYLASSEKSNSSYKAIDTAMEEVRQSGDLSVPLALRNAPTRLMKNMNYGKGYQYSHDGPGHFVYQEFLPEELSHSSFYKASSNSKEQQIAQKLNHMWKGKYNH